MEIKNCIDTFFFFSFFFIFFQNSYSISKFLLKEKQNRRRRGIIFPRKILQYFLSLSDRRINFKRHAVLIIEIMHPA